MTGWAIRSLKKVEIAGNGSTTTTMAQRKGGVIRLDDVVELLLNISYPTSLVFTAVREKMFIYPDTFPLEMLKPALLCLSGFYPPLLNETSPINERRHKLHRKPEVC